VKTPRLIHRSAAGSGACRHGLADILGFVSGRSDLAGALGFEVRVGSSEAGVWFPHPNCLGRMGRSGTGGRDPAGILGFEVGSVSGHDLADALEFGVGPDPIEVGSGSIEVDRRIDAREFEGLVEARGRDAEAGIDGTQADTRAQATVAVSHIALDAEAGIDWTQADTRAHATVTVSHIALVLSRDRQVSQVDRQLPAHTGSHQN
jgi:hypothetical protein